MFFWPMRLDRTSWKQKYILLVKSDDNIHLNPQQDKKKIGGQKNLGNQIFQKKTLWIRLVISPTALSHATLVCQKEKCLKTLLTCPR